MAYGPIDPTKLPPGTHYITVRPDFSSQFVAVRYWVQPGQDGPDLRLPYELGLGRFATKAEAIAEALEWASQEDLPYDQYLTNPKNV